MNFFSFIAGWISENPGKAAGAFIGFLIGVLVMTLGFWETFFIGVLVAIGIIIGKMKDDKIPVIDSLRDLLRRKR